jgi:hypothetical protein
MKRHMRMLSVALLAMVALLATAPKLWAIQFSQTKIIIEVNATDGDGGIQISVDAEGWNRLEVIDPDRQTIFDVSGSGSVGTTGVTELFFESAEPSFEDLPLDQLLARFRGGDYRFAGTTVDGKQLTGRATLKHNIPAGPTVTSPGEGAALNPDSPVVVDWDPVTGPFPGTSLPVTIAGYQVIVERVKPQPLLIFSVFLPATVTKVTIPGEFIEANADYKFEVLAIEASGNQTITESSFATTAATAAETDIDDNESERGRDVSGIEAPGGPRVAYLRQNHPNPFNPTTALEFGLPRGGVASVRVFDLHGRLVRTLVNGQLPAGQHRANWDGRDGHGRPVASGVYVVELAGPDVSESRRMILTK